MTMNVNRKNLWSAAAAIGMLLLNAVTCLDAQSAEPKVLSPDAEYFGRTYGEWATASWQWALSMPVHNPPCAEGTCPSDAKVTHPLADPTGTYCGVGQSGPVWFLGGVITPTGVTAVDSVVRHCSMPSSKALFIPLFTAECSLLEGTNNGCAGTRKGLRDTVRGYVDGTDTLMVDIDGAAIQVPLNSSFRVGSPRKTDFFFTLPIDDILSYAGEGVWANGVRVGPFKPGDYFPVSDDGYVVMLAPLATGMHKVHFYGAAHGDGWSYGLDVTYYLTVE